MAGILGRVRSDLKLQRIIIAVLGILAAVSLMQGIRNAIEASQDFQWDAAKTLVLKINPYDESLSPSDALKAYGFEKYYLQMEANQFPSLLLLLFPYTLLQPLVARYAWLLSNLLFTAGIILLLRKTFLRREAGPDSFAFTSFMLLMIAGTPYRNQLGVGQHTLFAFFFFLLAVYCIERKAKGILGPSGKTGFKENLSDTSVCGALCLFFCFFKYTLTVPLALFFIYKKRYGELVFSVLAHVLLTGMCALWLKDSFINMIIKPLKVSSRLAAEGGLDFGALLNGSAVSYVLAFAVMIALLWLSIAAGRLGASENDAIHLESLLFSILILWSLIITYHRTYDFFVIVTVLSLMYVPNCPKYIKILYGLTIIGVFFILRLFSEAPASKAAVGAIYYIFTILVTIWGVKCLIQKKRESS